MKQQRRIILGITGATGFVYGVRALTLLKPIDIEVHLVVSKSAQLTRAYEIEQSFDDIKQMADKVYAIDDLAASIASGSFRTIGMLIAPCSMKTLASIASGLSDNLLTRAADVVLKERRKLVLMTRETPLHLGHIRNMASVTEMGGIIFPPVPAMYQKPRTVEDIVTDSVSRALSLFDIIVPELNVWEK